VFLLRGADALDGSHFLALDEALQRGRVVVHETGQVGQLEIEKTSTAQPRFFASFGPSSWRPRCWKPSPKRPGSRKRPTLRLRARKPPAPGWKTPARARARINRKCRRACASRRAAHQPASFSTRATTPTAKPCCIATW